MNHVITISCVSGDCPVVCNGNGQYIGGVCHCNHGWKGQECNVPENECEVPNCNGNGRCINGECHCLAGFKGPHCGLGMLRSELELILFALKKKLILINN